MLLWDDVDVEGVGGGISILPPDMAVLLVAA